MFFFPSYLGWLNLPMQEVSQGLSLLRGQVWIMACVALLQHTEFRSTVSAEEAKWEPSIDQTWFVLDNSAIDFLIDFIMLKHYYSRRTTSWNKA